LGNISSFGVDADGELFVINYGAGAVLRILPRPPPDLVVSAVTPPATGVSGRTIQVLNKVRNIGGRTAVGPFRVDIYLSADNAPGTGVLIGSRTIASLVAGAESAQSTLVAVPPTTAPGFYFVSAI